MAFISRSPMIAGRHNKVCNAAPLGSPAADELCAELHELETRVTRKRLPQIVAKRFSSDQSSPFSAKLKTLAPPMTRWSMTLTSINAKQFWSRFVIISSAWLRSHIIDGWL
jgi:hypothetical protein